MSKAKFAAVKELIAEKNYDVARNVLTTMNSPTAKQWLVKLDEISPPMMESQEGKYYRRENERRSRRDLGSGLSIIAGGILILLIGIYASLPSRSLDGTTTTIELYWLCITLPMAFIAFGLGAYRIRKR